jgi:putative Mn2+ efflux pump MntP
MCYRRGMHGDSSIDLLSSPDMAQAVSGFFHGIFTKKGETNMQWDILFFFNSVLLGVGLAMDAFSVSLANGLNEPRMSRRRMLGIAGVFAGFQALMPMTGWICVHTIVQYFRAFEKLIPWIALALLGFIGGKMLVEGIHGGEDDSAAPRLGLGALLVQGVATSIDALSVGFTIAEYDWLMALVCSLIIAAVTLCICLGGLVLGRKFGMRLAGRAQILGGAILIFIGLEIFISSML